MFGFTVGDHDPLDTGKRQGHRLLLEINSRHVFEQKGNQKVEHLKFEGMIAFFFNTFDITG